MRIVSSDEGARKQNAKTLGKIDGDWGPWGFSFSIFVWAWQPGGGGQHKFYIFII
jgi:hypothetical protein